MENPSIRTMVANLSGMLGCNELTEWEEEFITDMDNRATRIVPACTLGLSPKQEKALERTWKKYFSDKGRK
jgi:hypothetical protein